MARRRGRFPAPHGGAMKRAVLACCALALAVVFAARPAHAQTTCTIVGTVSDAETKKPVDGAVIVVRSPALQGEQVAN